ncbi:hypothetical protein [Kumtagia ephedrae]|uniref:hypothetical protein n=1 Tax=Kumtagia ephedrae TaxID=2116701 RepID=UPI001056F2A9|nr:hypothetical protein [Mesorhizobium ephedrae]
MAITLPYTRQGSQELQDRKYSANEISTAGLPHVGLAPAGGEKPLPQDHGQSKSWRLPAGGRITG